MGTFQVWITSQTNARHWIPITDGDVSREDAYALAMYYARTSRGVMVKDGTDRIARVEAGKDV